MISKLANAFVPDAEMSAHARRLFPFGSASSVDWLRHRMGGLWVGGTVTLTQDMLSFSPNGMNAAAHESDVSVSVALDRVGEVADRFGWFTRIIDVRAVDGDLFTFRCFGARAFAEEIRLAVVTARSKS